MKLSASDFLQPTLESSLPHWLPSRRWFGGKARTIAGAGVLDRFPLSPETGQPAIFIIEVRYNRGPPEIYLLPAAENAATPEARIGESGWCECLNHGSLWRTLLGIIVRGESLRGERGGALVGNPGQLPPHRSPRRLLSLPWRLGGAEQSNSSATFGDTFFLKLYRRMEKGINPEVEMLKALTDQGVFRHLPPFRGAIEYCPPAGPPASAAVLIQCIPRALDAWTWALAAVDVLPGQVIHKGGCTVNPPELPEEALRPIPDALRPALDEIVSKIVCKRLILLGERTAEMHLALAKLSDDPAFAPEPLLLSDLQIPRRAGRARGGIIPAGDRSGEVVADSARLAEKARNAIQTVLNSLSNSPALGEKIRIHGDYHLGQVLITPKDLLVIDFEGEPARSISERRAKQSPLKDVAGMIRSFHYASWAGLLLGNNARPWKPPPDQEAWADFWYRAASRLFFGSYLERLGEKSPLLPADRKTRDGLLKLFLLEKALCELAYELNHRPAWAGIPLRGIASLLAE